VQSVFNPEDYSDPTSAGLVAACVPGIVMTPISSLLEATHAGHMNKAPLTTRWIYGLAPRSLREIIFGVGINQLSEWCEERMPFSEPTLNNFMGSMAAGVACGYLSHIPHNLSTLKLLQPKLTYTQHMSGLIEDASHRVPSGLPPTLRWMASAGAAIFFPKGVVIRSVQVRGTLPISPRPPRRDTTSQGARPRSQCACSVLCVRTRLSQIAGSFAIINGVINALNYRVQLKKQAKNG
jgi:hypothetical protein